MAASASAAAAKRAATSARRAAPAGGATSPARPGPARHDPARRRRVVGPARKPARRLSGPAQTVRHPFALPSGARVLDAMLSGRIWIALVGVLLVGIVFFNVDLLRMNRDITQMAERADRLNRENARIREEVAHLASSKRIQEAAARLGLVLPAPGDVRYLESNPRIDARNASRRIIPPTGAYATAAPVTVDPEPQPPPAASSTPTTTTTTPPTASVPPSTTTTTTTPPSSAALPAAAGG